MHGLLYRSRLCQAAYAFQVGASLGKVGVGGSGLPEDYTACGVVSASAVLVLLEQRVADEDFAIKDLLIGQVKLVEALLIDSSSQLLINIVNVAFVFVLSS